MDEIISTVATNLKSIRDSRGLSLDSLSELTGVSKSMLRQIEIGQSNPTISILWKIANGLQLPFTSLIAGPSPEVKVESFRESTPLMAEGQRYRVYPLIRFTPEQPSETYFMEIEPGVLFNGEPHGGNAVETVFVIRGGVEVILRNDRYQVERDSYISFQADQKHDYHNPGEETAAVLMQISYRP